MITFAIIESYKQSDLTKLTFLNTEELSKNIIKALENRSACLMSNHGQVAFGKNLEQAFELAQELSLIHI